MINRKHKRASYPPRSFQVVQFCQALDRRDREQHARFLSTEISTEACPLFERDKHSFAFSLIRIFMKLFRTGSVDMVTECQKMFNFLPLKYQIAIRTASFMLRFI